MGKILVGCYAIGGSYTGRLERCPHGSHRLAIRRALHDIRVPKDVVVTGPDEFAWRKDIVGTIEHPAVQEGTVLYVKG